jgi:hypothetical protein
MSVDQETIDATVQYLLDGKEAEAAAILRSCTFENFDIVDDWWDGSQRLEGVLIEVACPRSSYEVLMDRSHPYTASVENALKAVLPGGMYLKRLRARACPSKTPRVNLTDAKLSETDLNNLITEIEAQKALMISVATGGPRIKEVNEDYVSRRSSIKMELSRLGIEDPNPFPDLWTWHGRWSDGSLPTWQSRRGYITELYQPLLDALRLTPKQRAIQPAEPTGWARVDRNVEKISQALETARNEEDFQTVALLCREAIISLAQAVYNPQSHESPNQVIPSETDAKRMLEGYIEEELAGGSKETHRKYAKTCYDLAVAMQHRRTAGFRDAALCSEATRALINIIAIISGKRDPFEG